MEQALSGEPKSMAERISATLREEIVSGGLQPGQWLRQEELAERFGTSRIPVREALRQLEGEGLVNLVAHAGARVARLDPGELNEIYLMREQLEPLAVRMSAANLSDNDLEQLEALICEIESVSVTAQDRDKFLATLEVDRRFHALASSAANMPRLQQIVESLLLAAQPYRRAYIVLFDDPDHRRYNNVEHRLLLDALRRREADNAELIMRLHIGRTRHALMERAEALADLAPRTQKKNAPMSQDWIRIRHKKPGKEPSD
jgi:DNA-binding GntR family transcriptional regulator